MTSQRTTERSRRALTGHENYIVNRGVVGLPAPIAYSSAPWPCSMILSVVCSRLLRRTR